MQNVQMSMQTQTHRTGASQPLRALILDDSKVDRMRIIRMSQKAELNISFDEADGLRDFEAALGEGAYDLCLIDYRLSEGDGLIALEMLARHPLQKEARAMMIAGDSQIQVAIDAMKSGCTDFLLKDHLTEDRLSRAIGGMEAARLGRGVAPEAGQFARDHSDEMRAILSGMLRQVRNLRQPGPSAGQTLDGIEASCARLWNFLEDLKAAAPRATPPQHRLN